MKKGLRILLLTSLIQVSTQTLADNDSVADGLISAANVYVGIEGGYDASNARISLASGTKVNNSLTGYSYGAYIGSQTNPWNQITLGLEFFYDADSAYGGTHDSSTNTYNFHKKNDLGLSLIPGYLVSDNSKVYLRLGYVNANFKFSGTNPNFIDGLGSTQVNASNNLNGYQLGLGYLMGLPHDLGIRAEYLYSNFPWKVNYSGNGGGSFSSSFYSNEFKLGLEWILPLS